MPNIDIQRQRAAIEALAQSPELNIPQSLYDEIEERYERITDHLKRNSGAVAHLDPLIYTQGSFEIGTVIRPINKEGYDLDLVCELQSRAKTDQSQEELKCLVGDEVKAYAKQYGMKKPEEKPRCWHLEYRDDVTFHMDIIPAVPEDEGTKAALRQRVEPRYSPLVDTAIAITCINDDNYSVRTGDCPKSNPKGYAEWFRDQARRRYTELVELRKAEGIPTYRWQTPLQTVVQILKRHRDVEFGGDENAPISIIITTLAAQAYNGEADLRDALVGIVNGLPSFASDPAPRVQNPVNPDENFADKWEMKRERRDAYERWRKKVKRDVEELGQYATTGAVGDHFNRAFQATIKPATAARIVAAASAAAPQIPLRNEPRPWNDVD